MFLPSQCFKAEIVSRRSDTGHREPSERSADFGSLAIRARVKPLTIHASGRVATFWHAKDWCELVSGIGIVCRVEYPEKTNRWDNGTDARCISELFDQKDVLRGRKQ